jgi:hypothetical protein
LPVGVGKSEPVKTEIVGLCATTERRGAITLLFTDVLHYGRMFRMVVIVVVAAATYDLYFLDGKYTNAAQATATDLFGL